MRIRSVKTTVLQDRVLWAREIEKHSIIRPRVPRPTGSRVPWLGSTLVEIETDDGWSGVGIGGGGVAGKHIVETCLKPLLIDEDPLEIEGLWESMYRATFRFGQAGIVLMAMSGIDLALWDLRGKAMGQPVWALLGGKVRERSPVYATVRDAAWVQAHKFRGVKLGGPYGPADGPEGMRANEASVAAVRERVGPDFEIMIDCGRTWDVGYTIEMARILGPYRLLFIEEPLLSTDVEGYLELRRRIDSTRIACGEHVYTRYGARELLARGAVDIIQPDIRWTGGLSEALKISELAAAHGVEVMPHRGGMAWSLHMILARPECTLAEGLVLTPKEATYSVFDGEPCPEGGTLTASGAPGFGLTLRPERIDRFRGSV
jgi:L-rhamnonate dehydratase